MTPTAVKLVSCLRRPPYVSAQAFTEHWTGHHSSLLGRVRPLRSYVQYPVVGANPMSRQAVGQVEPFDGFEAWWWDSLDSLHDAREKDADLRAALEDRAYFIDGTRSLSCVVEEHVVTEPEGESGIVLVECHHHPPQGSREAFQESWLDVHGEFGRRIGAMGLMSGYLQNHVVSKLPAAICAELGLDQDRYDGIGMAYFESVPILQAMAARPVVTEEAFSAEQHFSDPAYLVSLLAHRRVVKTLVR
jgi:hypothetical protein